MRKYLYLVLACTIGLICCSKQKDEVHVPIMGTWVEKSDRNDTLKFYRIDSKDFFTLSTAVANSSGNPKYIVGPYEYFSKADSIRPVWLARSSIATEYYVFRPNALMTNLEIGNFYKSDRTDDILSFERISD